MNSAYHFGLEPPIGLITLVEEGDAVTQLHFGAFFSGIAEQRETPLLQEAARQLTAYFQGQLRNFSLPLQPKGTTFQRSVWEQLQRIPYGQTCSYGDIARACGNPKASRAVGMANNRNPISIIIPCHRVIGADGKLVGYGGGLDIKIRLLELEKTTLERG